MSRHRIQVTVNGVVHDFARWSDGGKPRRGVVTPGSDVTYTAEYRPRLPAASGPDLIAEIIEAAGAPGGSPAVAGGRGRAVIRISNTGAARFSGTSKVGLYLSTDPTLDDADQLIAAPARRLRLAPGASKILRLRLIYPAVAGSYYLIAEADATNAVPETDESNNAAASAEPLETLPA